VFYASIPAEGIRIMNPGRGAPPFLIPQASAFTTRVRFTPADFEAARRSMGCHKTQFSDEALARTTKAMEEVWKGELALSPMVPQASTTDLFQ
jgi:hypothetical protein